MEMKQCSAGHFYDAERYQSCPYCGTGSAQVSTQPHVLAAGDLGETQPAQATDLGVTVPIAGGETMPLDMVQKIRPVVGWLVCIEGATKGTDYRIHSQNNYIGRSAKMDISIPEDSHISAENSAIIAYDNEDRTFYFGPCSGRNIVRVNGRPALSVEKIEAYDVLTIGTTKLLFVPLCGDRFDWNEKK